MDIEYDLNFWIGFVYECWPVLLLCAGIIIATIWVFHIDEQYCDYYGAKPYIITVTIRRYESGGEDKFFKEYKVLLQFANIYENHYKYLLRQAGILDMYGCIHVSDFEKASDILYDFRLYLREYVA